MHGIDHRATWSPCSVYVAADPTGVLKNADRAERSVRRANGTLDALLAFSRASQEPDASEIGPLRATVENVLDELAPQAGEMNVSVECGEISDVAVRCNPELLHIVLANICGNAVKYLQRCQERRIRISTATEGPRCRIEVADTGPGIPENAREKIFQPFYRVAGAHASGTGIGLATVRRIVSARGGRIDVEPAPGGGSLFRVWLPLATAPEHHPSNRGEALATGGRAEPEVVGH